VAGKSFRDFMANGLLGHHATMGDWADHVTTVFTEVRLKRFLEMRGSDAGSPAMLQAQAAFWVGLLYDDAAQKAAAALTRGWSLEQVRQLRTEAPKQGLRASIAGRSLREVAHDVLAIAHDGLRARGLGEDVYLAPLDEIAASGLTQADRALHLYNTLWAGDAGRMLAAWEA
jgi:glutamate--cysteine ligase